MRGSISITFPRIGGRIRPSVAPLEDRTVYSPLCDTFCGQQMPPGAVQRHAERHALTAQQGFPAMVQHCVQAHSCAKAMPEHV